LRTSKLAVAVLFVVVSASARAAEVFVSTSGNDANPGTLAAPFATINKAATLARPGDIVSVRGGVYNAAVSIGSKGLATSRITFRSYPGETAVIDGTGLASTTILVNLYKTEFVDFEGFEVRNAPFIAINARTTRDTRIAGNDIHHAVRNAIYFGSDTMGTSVNATVENNVVHNNVLENQYHNMAGGWAGSVVVSRTNGGIVRGNRIFNNDGEAIIALLSDNVAIRGNETFDNFSQGVYLDNARYTTVDGNFIYCTGNTRYFRDGYPGQGIAVANEVYTDSNPSSDNTIVNNIVVGTRWGFYYGNFDNGGGLKNTTISNNTFYGTAQAILYISPDTHSNSVVENNIFQQAGGAGPSVSGAGVTYRNNNWYGVNAGSAAGSGDVYGNPALARAGAFTAGDYKITTGSAALAKAVDVSSLTRVDYFGAQRALPFDIGAHQLSAAAAVDTQAPSAPGNLHPTSGDATSIALAWNAATDNTAVVSYTIVRDGASIATVTGTTYSDRSVVSNVLYNYQVFANDGAGNRSVGSNVISVAWSSSQTGTDTSAPTAPSTPVATSVSVSSVTFAWAAATDDTGVTAYRVYQNGMLIGTTAGTAWSATSLRGSTDYSFSVVAVDAAGNTSPFSGTLTVRTTKAKGRAV
jgi:chitodextrinase